MLPHSAGNPLYLSIDFSQSVKKEFRTCTLYNKRFKIFVTWTTDHGPISSRVIPILSTTLHLTKWPIKMSSLPPPPSPQNKRYLHLSCLLYQRHALYPLDYLQLITLDQKGTNQSVSLTGPWHSDPV